MNRHWVIGDVHGCHQAMDRLLELLPQPDHIVFCGDVVGRGPDIVKTAERVWQLVAQGRATWLLGNHEQRLINDPELQRTLWPHAPDQAEQWVQRLRQLPLMFQGNGWVATHAGFDQHGQPDLEIREPFWTSYDGRFGRVVVAHTPGQDVRQHDQIVLIDTGAVYGGKLTAFCPETEAVIQVKGLELEPREGRPNDDAAEASDQPIRSLVPSGSC